MRLHPTLLTDREDVYRAEGGPWDIPCLDTLMSVAPLHAPVVGEASAVIVDGDERLTCSEVEERVALLAGGIRVAGVERGDVVAWQLPNGLDTILLSRACWRLGAIAAPLHHRAGMGELEQMLAVLAPKLEISASGLPLSSSSKVLRIRDDGRYLELGAGPPVAESAARGEDLALALFTSGSTGAPKAALHSHRSLGAKTLQMIAAHGLDHTDSTLVQSPISHISGMLNGVLVPGVAGMRQVVMDRWAAAQALELIARESVSFMVGPPAVFISLMEADDFTTGAVESLRVVSCGATGITPEFVTATAEKLGAVVKRSYGCTEAPTVTTSAVGDPPDRGASSDGRPLGVTEIRITDPESGAERGVGSAGEVWVRGPELFAGYAVAAQTQAAVVDGWFRTGDLGTLDADGWLTLRGRLKDVIIRGGENVVPAEVERVLERHPSVRQAVVVGVPDDRLGERIAAFVIGRSEAHAGDLDADDCSRWFAEQGVARFKAPEVVVMLDELPLLSLGKPDRAELRSRAREMQL